MDLEELRKRTLERTLANIYEPFEPCICGEKGANGVKEHTEAQFDVVFKTSAERPSSRWLYVKPCANHIANYEKSPLFTRVRKKDLAKALAHKSLHMTQDQKWAEHEEEENEVSSTRTK